MRVQGSPGLRKQGGQWLLPDKYLPQRQPCVSALLPLVPVLLPGSESMGGVLKQMCFYGFPKYWGNGREKRESEFCLALKSQLGIPEPGFCMWCKGIWYTAPLHPNQIHDSKTPTMSANFNHILKNIICSLQALTGSFPEGSLLKWHHQQRSQSSLPGYSSLLQGDTWRKQAHLLISSVFMFQKPRKEENQTSSKKWQEPFHCVSKFMANTVTE